MNKLLRVLASVAVALPGLAQGQTVNRSQVEAAPVPPKPEGGEESTVRLQSGIGSDIAYSRAGVVELGGSLAGTSARDFLSFGISPSIGWFPMDNVELTLIGNWTYAKVSGEKANHVGSLIVEPSYVMPLSNTKFVFLGVGIGGLFEYNQESGAAVAPRVGYKSLVGRSGLVTFAIQPIFSISDSRVHDANETVLTVKNAVNYGVGYTVLL